MHEYGKLRQYTMHELGLYSPLQKYEMQAENLSLPTDAHNVKKHRVIKTF